MITSFELYTSALVLSQGIRRVEMLVKFKLDTDYFCLRHGQNHAQEDSGSIYESVSILSAIFINIQWPSLKWE